MQLHGRRAVGGLLRHRLGAAPQARPSHGAGSRAARMRSGTYDDDAVARMEDCLGQVLQTILCDLLQRCQHFHIVLGNVADLGEDRHRCGSLEVLEGWHPEV